MAAAAVALERADVQGLVARGYGGLSAAAFLLCAISDADAARAWLATAPVSTGEAHEGDRALNLALTASGLAALGAPLDGFSSEFAEGMTTAHRRRVLGDDGDNAPERWAWGGPDQPAIDLVVLAYARDAAALPTGVAPGIDVVTRLDTAPLSDTEPFGFRDGISQPRIAGLGFEGPARDEVPTGEFVLGYPNAYGRLTPHPPQLGRNGSYLVLRTLAQDVAGFHAWAGGDTRRAAKLVGRWPSGTPLALSPDADRPVADAQDFAYHAIDPHGAGCPIGAHVRRANPRDTLDPAPGTEASVAVNRRHRLLRRGRAYGGQGGGEQGLHFICLGANLARQFEFVQHSWLLDPRFNGLTGEPDPLVGPGGGTFSMPAFPVRERATELPRFVTVRGGVYAFLPGIRALRSLARGGSSPRGW